MNKKLLTVTLILILGLILGLSTSCFAETKVKLKAGTMLYVQPMEDLDPEELNTGDSILFTVIGDIEVDGNVVIASGTPVYGTATKAQANGALGKPAKLTVTVDSIRAVDGTIISLSGIKSVSGEDKSTEAVGGGLFLCAPMLLMQGEGAIIPKSTKIEAAVTGTYTITVD